MKHYFRIIEKEDQYQFVLVPYTNLTLPMGYSNLYPDEEECRKACLDFKEMVKTKPAASCARIRAQGSTRVSYEFYDQDGNTILAVRMIVLLGQRRPS